MRVGIGDAVALELEWGLWVLHTTEVPLHLPEPATLVGGQAVVLGTLVLSRVAQHVVHALDRRCILGDAHIDGVSIGQSGVVGLVRGKRHIDAPLAQLLGELGVVARVGTEHVRVVLDVVDDVRGGGCGVEVGTYEAVLERV